MYAPNEKSKWRRKRTSKSSDDNDISNLNWLKKFRVSELLAPVDGNELDINESTEELVPDKPPGPKKPPYTYPELIERALREKGELTVSAIYQWISDRFPYYNANDERWKNSVRHNLSINPHFRKGARAPHGAGHLWSLAANAIDLLPLRNSPIYISERTGDYQDALIEYPKGANPPHCQRWSLVDNTIDLLPLKNGSIYIDEKTGETIRETEIIGYPKVIVIDEAAIAAANIISDQDIFTGSTMFLNPVSAEQVVRECGLMTVD